MTLAAIDLDDRYAQERGRVFLTGTQALVRLPMLQARRDTAAGHRTAAYVSGYRGSPLGGLDREMWRAKRFLEAHRIHFQPGVNEDLAATACWGSQQTGLFAHARYDGVFAMWYGKGPGVDRSGDALKHANLAGTAPLGGVLALAGDDHVCKSSTSPHQSELAFLDASIPVLAPAGVQDLLDLGLAGWALSRYAGLWVALKTVAEIVDSAAAVDVAFDRVAVVRPDDHSLPPGGLGIRWPDPPLEQERRLHAEKLPAARAFARANRLDRLVLGGRRHRLCVVTVGKAYSDVRQALEVLGIDAARARALGLAVYKVAMPWPLEPEGLRALAAVTETLLVVEEKRPLIEPQIKDLLYGVAASERPRVIGKTDEAGAPLLPTAGELTPAAIARILAARLGDDLEDAPGLARIAAAEHRRAAHPAEVVRLPYFCAGCPHNTSTRVPEGSRALAGIGCHYMALWMDRETATFTQMGAEGASWLGQAPFTETAHVFQNIGDGTYYHSGLLAIRAAVAAGVNITYKLLYNDAVAMTGGQPMDGPLSVAQITQQLRGEGVAAIAIVAETPERYRGAGDLAPGVAVHGRDALDSVQRTLRRIPGVSVLIYVQVCATEKRRRRKRGRLADPPIRVMINAQVCEGCGDCGVQSNCLAVVPRETAFGRKRAIDQSACNKDLSCLEGFCPSFVTVSGGRLRRPEPRDPPPAPAPTLPAAAAPYGILIAGIGGTGVVTLAALLGTAAHMEGRAVTVLDQTGLAQKYGAVVSHVRIADEGSALHAGRIGPGEARLILGCDAVVAASDETLLTATADATRAVVNARPAPTGDFARDPDLAVPAEALLDRLRAATGGAVEAVAASALAERLVGDAIGANLLLLGLAWQKGLVPLSAEAIEAAIALNGVAVEANRRAFRWGRALAEDPHAGGEAPAEPPPPADLEGLVAHRAGALTRYQDAAYAARYRALVARAADAERTRAPGSEGFARAVGRAYFKLLAYKDEYEVARLFTDGRFRAEIEARFEGDWRLAYHLAPPLLAARDPVTGRPRKRRFGPWMLPVMRLLARAKGLRGTPFDPFARTPERRAERAAIADYEALVARLIAGLDADNHAIAVALAGLPETVRGFGHVKAAAAEHAGARAAELLARFENGTRAAAE